MNSTCARCGKDTGGPRRHVCGACYHAYHAEKNREHYKANRDRILKQKQVYLADPEVKKQRQAYQRGRYEIINRERRRKTAERRELAAQREQTVEHREA